MLQKILTKVLTTKNLYFERWGTNTSVLKLPGCISCCLLHVSSMAFRLFDCTVVFLLNIIIPNQDFLFTASDMWKVPKKLSLRIWLDFWYLSSFIKMALIKQIVVVSWKNRRPMSRMPGTVLNAHQSSWLISLHNFRFSDASLFFGKNWRDSFCTHTDV